MARYNRNKGKHWSKYAVNELRRLANKNTPTRIIGLKLGRTEAGVRAKASEHSISLMPPNRGPYKGRKK